MPNPFLLMFVTLTVKPKSLYGLFIFSYNHCVFADASGKSGNVRHRSINLLCVHIRAFYFSRQYAYSNYKSNITLALVARPLAVRCWSGSSSGGFCGEGPPGRVM